MGELECQKKLTKLDDQREAAVLAMNEFVPVSNDLLKAFTTAVNNSSDTSLIDELNKQLGRFNSAWAKLDSATITWHKTMNTFRQEVLEPIKHRIKRDNT